MKKYSYYKIKFEPISNELGTEHEREFKAIDYEHALRQAKNEEKFSVDDKQVYRIVG